MAAERKGRSVGRRRRRRVATTAAATVAAAAAAPEEEKEAGTGFVKLKIYSFFMPLLLVYLEMDMFCNVDEYFRALDYCLIPCIYSPQEEEKKKRRRKRRRGGGKR